MASLLHQTLRGLAKTASFTALKSATDVGTFFALVWILQSSEPWGDLALALAFLELAHQLSSFGGARYLTQRREITRDTIATVTTAETGAALLWATVWWFGSPALLTACGWSHLGGAARWFAPWLITERLGQPARAVLEREMRFGRSNGALFLGTATFSAVAISLATLGWGVNALVAGRVAQSAVTATAMWILARQPVRAGWSRAEAKPYFDFGLRLFAADLMLLYNRNIPQLILGLALKSPGVLGAYYVASRLPDYLRQIQDLTASVFYPAFTRARDDGQLRQGFEMATKYSAAIALLPLSLVLVLGSSMAGHLIPPEFRDGILALQVFTALAVLRIVTNHWYFAYLSKGLTRGLPELTLLNSLLVTLGAVIGLRWGITGVAFGVAIPAAVVALLSVRLLLPRAITVSYSRPLAIPGLVALLTVLAGSLLRWAGLDPAGPVSFWTLVVLMTTLYAALGLALDAKALRDLSSKLRR